MKVCQEIHIWFKLGGGIRDFKWRSRYILLLMAT